MLTQQNILQGRGGIYVYVFMFMCVCVHACVCAFFAQQKTSAKWRCEAAYVFAQLLSAECVRVRVRVRVRACDYLESAESDELHVGWQRNNGRVRSGVCLRPAVVS